MDWIPLLDVKTFDVEEDVHGMDVVDWPMEFVQ
jgi:hypothetical protein